jgi:hypothetical protein
MRLRWNGMGNEMDMTLTWQAKHPSQAVLTYCPKCHVHSGEVPLHGQHMDHKGYICTTQPVTVTYRLTPMPAGEDDMW